MNDIPFIGLFYGLFGVILFRFKNSNRDFINVISVALITIFFTELLFFYVNETSGIIGWIFSGCGLLAAYFIRFKNKKIKKNIDYLKIFAIVLIICYPFNFYTLNFFVNKWYLMISFAFLIIPAVGTIYIYDRIILKPQPMKTKFIAILVIQTALIFICLVYALVQQTAAIKSQREAVANANEAQKQATMKNELQLKFENCCKK